MFLLFQNCIKSELLAPVATYLKPIQNKNTLCKSIVIGLGYKTTENGM